MSKTSLIQWCWKCNKEQFQTVVERIYETKEFAVINFECSICKSHNKTVISKGKDNLSEPLKKEE